MSDEFYDEDESIEELRAAWNAGEKGITLSSQPNWQRLALHALSDLQILGVPIEKIIGVTDEILMLVNEYNREMTTYS